MLNIWKQCNKGIGIFSKLITFGGLLFLILEICVPDFSITRMNQLLMAFILFSWSISAFSAYYIGKKRKNIIIGIIFLGFTVLNVYAVIPYLSL